MGWWRKRDVLWRQILPNQKTQMVHVVLMDGSAITGRCSQFSDDDELRELLIQPPLAEWVPEPALQHVLMTSPTGETKVMPGPAVLIVNGIQRIEFWGSGEIGAR